MKKIICLVGKSGSGKDTIIQKLRADLKIPIAISFTSRPMRSGEIQDLTYHFVSDNYFEDNKEKFIEQLVKDLMIREEYLEMVKKQYGKV